MKSKAKGSRSSSRVYCNNIAAIIVVSERIIMRGDRDVAVLLLILNPTKVHRSIS